MYAMDKKLTINGANFQKLISRAFMKGIVDECLIKIDKDGVAGIQAVDMTNSVLVSSRLDIEADNKEEMEFGLSRMSVLNKFFSGSDQIVCTFNTTKEEDVQVVFRKKGKGNLKCLTLKPDSVPTALESEVEFKTLLDGMALKFQTNHNSIRQLSEYVTLTGAESVVFRVSEKKKITVSNSHYSEMHFDLPIKLSNTEELQKKIELPFEVEVHKNILTVMDVAQETYETDPPVIYLGHGAPILVYLNDTNFWALTPIE